MSKETRNQAMALAGIVVTVMLTALCYHCYFVVDFDKPLPAIDPDVFTCNEDSDCRPNPDNTQDDCRVCNMDIGECEWSGTNNDSDGWYVCDGARDPDCDDGDNSVYPGAVETANLVNDDCDNLIDEGTLSAKGTSTVVSHGSCATCEWAGPVAVYDSPNLAVIWESDEDVSVKRLRTAEIAFPASPQSTDQYIYVGPDGTTTYNMTDPFLATAGDSLGAAWIDHLGGKKLYFAKYDLTGGAPGLTCATWPGSGTPDCAAYPGTFPENPATPVVAARPSAPQYAVAFVGGATGAQDVYLTRFNTTNGALASSDGGDFIALGATAGAVVTDRPALADAYSGYVVGWVEDNSTIQLVYWNKTSSYDNTKIVSYAPAGLSDFRDPVLVASHAHPDISLVYLVFAAKPAGDDQPEVYAVSIQVDHLDPATPAADVFGPVLQVSVSANRLSADVSATWWDKAIGIAWSDRRTDRRIWFRRIADLENGSGTLASQEIDVSGEGTEPNEFDGQNPSIVALGNDYDFGIIWSNGTDMFVRKVED